MLSEKIYTWLHAFRMDGQRDYNWNKKILFYIRENAKFFHKQVLKNEYTFVDVIMVKKFTQILPVFLFHKKICFNRN
jgi:hypothetical protein